MSHVGLLATFVIRKCTHMTQPLPCEANGYTCTMCLMPPWRAGFALFVEKMFYQSATQVAFSQRQHSSSPAHSADTLIHWSWYTEETVLMCTSHAQTRTAAWSKPFPGPEQFPQPAGCHPHGWQSVCYIHCSKHLGQALPAFSDSGQKFKYCFKWIKN